MTDEGWSNFGVQLTAVIFYNSKCSLVYRISNARLVLTVEGILSCS